MKTCHRAAAVGAGLVCAVLGLAALTSCNKGPLIAPTTQVSGAYEPLDYWIGLIAGDARRWRTLKSDCVIMVRNPRIPRPGNQVAFSSGTLLIDKRGGKVRLEATRARNEMLLRVVGDGELFRADLPVFRDSYGGTYTDTRPVQMAHVPILPADVASAFDPLALLAGRARLITQWERFTAIDSILLVHNPEPDFVKTSALLIDRMTERISTVEKYAANGRLRSRVTITQTSTLTTGDGESASVPTDFLIEYPDARTVIRIVLTKPRLNVAIDPELFDVRR